MPQFVTNLTTQLPRLGVGVTNPDAIINIVIRYVLLRNIVLV
jgi:hypothetical protein